VADCFSKETERAIWLESAEAFNIPALAPQNAQKRRVSGTPQTGKLLMLKAVRKIGCADHNTDSTSL
jgi:hypothetical protein